MDEPCVFQNLQVLRHRRLCERDHLHQISTNAALLPREKPNDLDSSGMSDRFCQHGELCIGLISLRRTEVEFSITRFTGRLNGHTVIVNRKTTIKQLETPIRVVRAA